MANNTKTITEFLQSKSTVPVTMEAPGTMMRGLTGYGGMTVAFNEKPAAQIWLLYYKD